jgi:hypothetical protein
MVKNMKMNNVSAPAKLMKNDSSSRPKSVFHAAIYNMGKIINNYELEKDKKRIDKSFNYKFSKNEKLVPDNVLLNNIYRKPRRKFIITVVSPPEVSSTASSKSVNNTKGSTKTVRRKFIITDNDTPQKLNYKLV